MTDTLKPTLEFLCSHCLAAPTKPVLLGEICKACSVGGYTLKRSSLVRSITSRSIVSEEEKR